MQLIPDKKTKTEIKISEQSLLYSIKKFKKMEYLNNKIKDREIKSAINARKIRQRYKKKIK